MTGAINIFIFQPTRPLRGATLSFPWLNVTTIYFNPRAPCGARLQGARGELFLLRDFNPRAPCGARPPLRICRKLLLIFQPTRPLRGATLSRTEQENQHRISTHAPLAGRDSHGGVVQWSHVTLYFNPRAPCGARRISDASRGNVERFQPTRPLRGATG